MKPDGRLMSFIADWNRPSTLLLAAVLAANVVMPLVHFWPREAGADEAVRTAPQASSRSPARAPSGQAVEPIVAALPAKRVALQKAAPVCRAWGPFTASEEAESAAARLQLETTDFEVLEADVPARPDYLVKVRAPGSREAAGRAISELRSLDVDSYILERDRQGSVLAAGVFSNPARAESLRRKLTGLGYDATVAQLDRSHRVYHLMARLPPDFEPEIPAAGTCSDIARMGQFL